MVQFVKTNIYQYASELYRAREQSEQIRDATTRPSDMPGDAIYYLTPDLQSGFGVTKSGELIGVFSLVKGRGNDIVHEAIRCGATHLDCFDGYLVGLYARHGFAEYRRVPNWVPGGPDVVFMSRPSLLVQGC